MREIVVVFPGQGSQYVGMGKKLENDAAFNLFARADQTLDFSLTTLMFAGPEDQLKLTKNAQPAIIAHSLALYSKCEDVLRRKNHKVSKVLGHSVGEYAALAAAGVLSFEDAIKAVHLRGKFMQEAVAPGQGKMYAIMKVPEETVRKACLEACKEGTLVMPANFNEPNQIVISGEAEACTRAIKWMETNHQDRFRAMELNVSAPFHSSFMKPAAEELTKAFTHFKWHTNNIPYIANIDATEYAIGTNVETIKKNLIEQVAGSVLWTHSIRKLAAGSLVIEAGPGKVLKGLISKINPELKVISLDDDAAWNELEEII